jgi:DNA-binding transcriptional MerR regulator
MSSELIKLYYRIGEVSSIVGVQPHVLRYWESEFRTIRPQKSSKGQRVYSKRDVERLLFVKDLLKNQGFTIAGAKRRLREPQTTGSTGAVASGTLSAVALAPSAAPSALSNASVTTVPDAARSAVGQEMGAVDGKGMRRALLQVREELAIWIREIEAGVPGRA